MPEAVRYVWASAPFIRPAHMGIWQMNADLDETAKQRIESEYGIYLPTLAIGPGWLHLVRQFLDEAKICGLLDRVTVLQIKEKFGQLRIYFRGDNEHPSLHYLRRRVRALSDASLDVCEVCGKPGSHRTINYLHLTRCDDCYAARRDA